MMMELTGEVRARLDAHLDAVEAALLKSGRPREQRRAVVDDLETQLLDMLARRSDAPSLADIEAVLAGLDPPSAYGEAQVAAVVAPVAGSVERPRYSRLAIAGFVCIVASLVPLLVFVSMALYMAKAEPPRPRGLIAPQANYERDPATGNLRQTTIEMAPPAVAPAPVAVRGWMGTAVCVFFGIGPLGLAGTVLGWVAFGQIRRSGGRIEGKGLALFDGLFYPVVVPVLLMLVVA